VVFAWSYSVAQVRLPNPTPVIDVPVTAGAHYFRVQATYGTSYPGLTISAARGKVIEISAGQTLDVSPLFFDRRERGKGIDNLDIDIEQRVRPGGPAPTAAGSGG
jgi:hypothetical protein